jgi:RNA polymerase sigma factor (sigma-70 family)
MSIQAKESGRSYGHFADENPQKARKMARVPSAEDDMSEIPTPEWPEAAERLRPALLRWASSQMPDWLRGRLDPEDLVQQALAEARPPAGLSEAQLLAFLRRAVSNDLIDAARKHARAHGDVPLDVLAASSLRLIDWLADDATSPSVRADRADRFARVAEALAALPDAQRVAVEMRYLRQCKVKEIAEVLGRSEGAVAQLLVRALDGLSHVLRDLGE